MHGHCGPQLSTLRNAAPQRGWGPKVMKKMAQDFPLMLGRGSVRAGPPASFAVHCSKLQQLVGSKCWQKPMRPACKGMLLKISRGNQATPNPPWTAIDAGAPARTELSPYQWTEPP